MHETVVIIGGGLAGLTAAYKLKKEGINATVLEANIRFGGRIYTKQGLKGNFELGATWVFQDHNLKQLIAELGLELYPQFLEGDALIKYDPSMAIQRSPTASLMNGAVYHKVKGGTGTIIEALSDQLDNDQVQLNKKVKSLIFSEDFVKIVTRDETTINASKVIIAVPPKLVAEQIAIEPALGQDEIMASTHTWMAESSKFTVLFDKDYWRLNNLSGFVYSNYGLIREIQDHTAEDGKSVGLVGFMQPDQELATDHTKRKKVAFSELRELFGIEDSNILGYDDFQWNNLFVDEHQQNFNAELMAHQNNGNPFYSISHYENKLFFAGAETSPTNPGYMEGAVISAYRAVELLKSTIK